ncbi:MAG: hypothetical protein A3B70_01535 [Deltaproteobacteria bacterium RIFCSPHIGHO2_02_FULL_40_11]|nr:MAG: hypothetical protein A3B70_01535 [Deltaproteobacteria bacterium RIFCSPHIGHO2_02_FULL_40_11]
MLLVLDIGNTQTVCGLYRGKSLLYFKRVETRKILRGLRVILSPKFCHPERSEGSLSSIIMAIHIASVVPSLNVKLKKKLKAQFKTKNIHFLSHRSKLPIKLNVKYPKEVGADRLSNMTAAVKAYRAPVLIIDFGTATTIDYVDSKNRYQGGVIMPGLKTAMDALFQKAEKLKPVPLHFPRTSIGKTTKEQLQIGAILAHVEMVEGMVRRMRKETKTHAKIILTGGWAGLISKHLTLKHIHDPYLTLKGLR